MQAHGLGFSMFQAIVEPLVVAKIESLLLELPFEIPICLRNKKKARMGLFHRGNDLAPVVRRRARPGAVAPGSLEYGIEEQHRHVASHAVALLSDAQKCPDSSLSLTRVEGVQLQHIRPGWKVRIAPAGEYVSGGLQEAVRVIL